VKVHREGLDELHVRPDPMQAATVASLYPNREEIIQAGLEASREVSYELFLKPCHRRHEEKVSKVEAGE